MNFKSVVFSLIFIFSSIVNANWYDRSIDYLKKNKKSAAAILATAAIGTLVYKWWQSKTFDINVQNFASNGDIEHDLGHLFVDRGSIASLPIYDPLVHVTKDTKLGSNDPLSEDYVKEGKELATKSVDAADSVISFEVKPEDARREEQNKGADKSDNGGAAAHVQVDKKIEKEKNKNLDIKFSDIQEFCDLFNGSIKDKKKLIEAFRKFFKIKSYYEDSPYLFEQLFLENLNQINDLCEEYSLFIEQIQEDAKRDIWNATLSKARLNLDRIYKNGPWFEGRRLIGLLLAGDPLADYKDKENYQNHLIKIVCIVWHLYEIAIQKGQVFNEGTFNIHSKKIFDFIVAYDKKYDRSGNLKSSHYHEINKEKFGIDLPLECRDQWCLPNNKYHMLIGDVTSEAFMAAGDFVFMLKPEKYGISYSNDIVNHFIEFIERVPLRLIPGANQKAGNRKEHLSHDIYQAFKKLYTAHFGNSWYDYLTSFFGQGEHSVCMENVKNFGVKAIQFYLNKSEALKGNSVEQIKARKDLDGLLKKLDNLESRRGQEVIFTEKDLNPIHIN